VVETLINYANEPVVTRVNVKKDTNFNLSHLSFCTIFEPSPINESLLQLDYFHSNKFMDGRMLDFSNELFHADSGAVFLEHFKAVVSWIHQQFLFEHYVNEKLLKEMSTNFTKPQTIGKSMISELTNKTEIKNVAQIILCLFQLNMIKEIPTNKTTVSTNCSSIELSWFHVYMQNELLQICAKPLSKYLELGNVYDSISVNILISDNKINAQYFFIFGPEEYVSYDTESIVGQLKPGKTVWIMAQLLGDYRNLNRSSSVCTDTTELRCKYNCEIDYITQHCKCNPLSR